MIPVPKPSTTLSRLVLLGSSCTNEPYDSEAEAPRLVRRTGDPRQLLSRMLPRLISRSTDELKMASTSMYGDKYDVQVNIHESGFIESESLPWASGGDITFHRYE